MTPLASASFLLGTSLLVTLGLSTGRGEREEADRRIDFSREIRPILSNNCFSCHGPDEAQREAGLRLDLRDEAFRDLGGYTALSPGAPEESELYLRVADADDPMPPAHATRSLEPSQIETLRLWIEQGAQWEEHWAYVPPARTTSPDVGGSDWVKNDVDPFVLARLEAAGLEPSPQADPATLVRRLSLDLTGLPPTPEEVERYLGDRSENRYARLVERLLASPRYGEHMARAWLDAVRYGDTHGFHLDNERSIWPYRDWVIGAFNENLPFDRFTIEQIAGDLLPDATRDQRVATGYNRCNPTTAEGGFIAEEYLARYASDRVTTTATVWLGTTMLCAQCHDHKYDPVSQREFYGLFAFFNNTAENASDGNQPAPPPVLAVPSEAETAQLATLAAAIDAKRAETEAPLPEVDRRQSAWEDEWRGRLEGRWSDVTPLAFESRGDATLELLEDGSLRATGENPATDAYELLLRTDLAGVRALRLEVLGDESCEEGGVGRASNGNFVLTEVELAAVDAAQPGRFAPVTIARAQADFSQKDYDIGFAVDGKSDTGWAVDGLPDHRTALFALAEPLGGEQGALLRLRLGFDSRFAQHALGRFRISLSTDPTLSVAEFGPWYTVGPFPEESSDAAFEREFGPEAGVDLSAEFEPGLTWTEQTDWQENEIHTLPGEISATYLFRTVDAPAPRELELSLGSDDAVRLWLNGELLLDERVARGVARDQNQVRLPLLAGRNELLVKVVNFGGAYAFTARRSAESLGGLPLDVQAALLRPELDDGAQALLRDHFRRRFSPEWGALRDELVALEKERAAFEAAIPVTLVTEERMDIRPAHVLLRGQYDQPGDEVQPRTPGFLPPLPRADDGRATRLDLAHWLVNGDNPLTARVTVNRFWQELFGTGLVSTPEDFGAQGDYPSHPELLDWLALEFVESGWDVKALLRTIVTSGTYRQGSTSSPERRALDPENRLLSRGPRHRLDAERIRDSALAISGLLVEEIGGPSVRPYQPDGVWEAVAYTSSNTAKYQRDEGQALYRRSLYTFWKRTAPPASMQIFDAPTREACEVARARTNTPLQALVLLNDVQFVEAARHFAETLLARDDESDEERLAHAFRRATARPPTPSEARILVRLLAEQRAEFLAHPEEARRLAAIGMMAIDGAPDPLELAAWTVVANALLNLDEVLTQG